MAGSSDSSKIGLPDSGSGGGNVGCLVILVGILSIRVGCLVVVRLILVGGFDSTDVKLSDSQIAP